MDAIGSCFWPRGLSSGKDAVKVRGGKSSRRNLERGKSLCEKKEGLPF
ncbi:hypothetical protein CLOSTMETH_01943 [[Clostridium] methylpentosum DSM 5476]|uniref:Uncharacterized protein n=1 Tax=[Clostridium] methylpentosum DSM 5476 TaxID=537013 RepID=C0EDL5_9FIRM|nr:hypothetical protein CLOSTMETH_01943 [[Clostridium] methylpentosum DSM 5476]